MRVASIATYVDRLGVLPDAVRSLAPQVDVVQIYYNGEPDDAGYFIALNSLIKVAAKYDTEMYLTPVKDLADLSKFRAIWDYPDATIFTCDDDLIYDPEYIYKLSKNLYHDPLITADVVSLGGKVVKEGKPFERAKKWKDLFLSRVTCFSKNNLWMQTTTLDIPLSGVSVFKAKDFQDCKIDEKYKYAADIQLGKWCKDKGLIVKNAWNRPRSLVKYNPKMNGKETIFDKHTSKDNRIVSLVKEIWKSDL
jgi:hypothetical protein